MKTTGLPGQSTWLFNLFKRYCRGYLRRHFHSIRLARADWPMDPVGEPVIIAFNHPSWWDPLIAMALSGLMPGRTNYGPIDARALGKYRFFQKLGFFPVEQGTRKGAISFLRTSEAILKAPNTSLWIAAQGRFTDVRERPVQLRPGIGHLVHRLDRCVILPLAIEYTFWTERLPEALARFGSPIRVDGGGKNPPEEWVRLIEANLTATLDALAQDSQQRNADAFAVLLGGKAGVGGIYDLWRRFKAFVQGRQFVPEHGAPDSSQSLGEVL